MWAMGRLIEEARTRERVTVKIQQDDSVRECTILVLDTDSEADLPAKKGTSGS